MDDKEQAFQASDDMTANLAYQAWLCLDANGRRPQRIDYLRGRPNHRIVFRLYGVGVGETSLIAKGSKRPGIHVERMIYEHVLSRMPINAPRYYGFVEAFGDLSWLFLEDAGEEEFVPSDADHRAAASRWLALLHASAPGEIAREQLQDRGPGHYLDHLQEGRARILGNIEHEDLTAEEQAMLRAVSDLCDETEKRWQRILALCEGLPQTIVHGDFQPKNIRVQGQGDSLRICVFDWEKTGWGMPGPDLAPNIYHQAKQTDLATYWRLVSGRWPELDQATVNRMANLGHLFRLLASIDWASQSLGFPKPEKPVAQLQIYRVELDRIIHEQSLGSVRA